MKFTYSFVIAAVMQTYTPADVALTDYTTCTQHQNATDYGNAWTSCMDTTKFTGEETAGCCAKFSYTLIDTELGYDEGILTEIDQPRCLYDSDRRTHASNITEVASDVAGTVYSWYCLLDAVDEVVSV
tara:strand:+ start:65 stop:448 length:384 start_codon:yes stop_codon:yes gene_type:complete